MLIDEGAGEGAGGSGPPCGNPPGFGAADVDVERVRCPGAAGARVTVRHVSVLSEHVLGEIRELPARYPQPRSAVMPALDLAQEEVGHLTPETMSEVAAALNLDPGYVEGVATFYTLFHLAPVGKHRFYVCTNLSCMLRGAEDIVARVKQATGLNDPHDVTADGLFSYDEVECLGACEFAPMLRLDHRYHYDLTPEKIDELVAERKSGGTPKAQPPEVATTHKKRKTGRG
jgi:NADH-quinone oxidoreductase subunit E